MRPRHPRAFTLIELLVVIGILMVLISIVAYGIGRVMDHTKRANTRVLLENMKSMISEFEVATKGLTRQPGQMWVNGNPYQPGPTQPPIDIWHDANPTDGTAVPEPDALQAPGDVRKEANESPTNNQRYASDGIANTQLVMGLLLQAAGNKTILAQFRSSQLMEAIPAAAESGAKLTLPQGSNTPQPSLVLDAWGNPILFVPAGGLFGVTAGDVYHDNIVPAPGAHNGPIKSPDNRPFWASAGPDGDFSKGDDNMYSFEQ